MGLSMQRDPVGFACYMSLILLRTEVAATAFYPEGSVFVVLETNDCRSGDQPYKSIAADV